MIREGFFKEVMFRQRPKRIGRSQPWKEPVLGVFPTPCRGRHLANVRTLCDKAKRAEEM